MRKDPVIEAYKAGVDRTLIRENLRLTPEERVRNLQQLQRFAEELRGTDANFVASLMVDFHQLLAALNATRVSFVIVGGMAATVHGSARLTADLDIVYDRSLENLQRLVSALQPLQPYLRGAPPGLPFRLDVETLQHGLNFTLTSTAGPIDLLGEVSGIGDYRAVNEHAIDVPLFGGMHRCLGLDALIIAKRAAGRPRDFEVIAELEAIRDESGGGSES